MITLHLYFIHLSSQNFKKKFIEKSFIFVASKFHNVKSNSDSFSLSKRLKKNVIQYAILGILILTFSASNSSKDGAPPSACVEMTPHHDEYVKQTDTSPFEIEVVSMDQQAIVV
ncbi:hypothetical protein Avbf_12183 [Armadillidium vulgare]|nr:hypothetical protein Avbf_12183 [Armadillidium vulgare]